MKYYEMGDICNMHGEYEKFIYISLKFYRK